MTTAEHPTSTPPPPTPPHLTPPPAVGPPPPPRPPSPPPARRMSWGGRALIAAAVLAGALVPLAVAAASSAVDRVADRVDAEEARSQEDASIAACRPEAGSLTALVEVTNHSSGTSTYVIDIAFTDADGATVDGAAVTVSELPAHASVTDEAHVSPADAGAVHCHIVHVERFAS